MADSHQELHLSYWGSASHQQLVMYGCSYLHAWLPSASSAMLDLWQSSPPLMTSICQDKYLMLRLHAVSTCQLDAWHASVYQVLITSQAASLPFHAQSMQPARNTLLNVCPGRLAATTCPSVWAAESCMVVCLATCTTKAGRSSQSSPTHSSWSVLYGAALLQICAQQFGRAL